MDLLLIDCHDCHPTAPAVEDGMTAVVSDVRGAAYFSPLLLSSSPDKVPGEDGLDSSE